MSSLFCVQVEEHKDLQLLLSITDLLASCAEGENLFVESTCQSIFKVHCTMPMHTHHVH